MVSVSLTDARYGPGPKPHLGPIRRMLIVCPNCATSYQVEASVLGSTGRSVRCVRCRNVWFAHDPAGLLAIADAHRSDMQTLAASIAAVAHGEGDVGEGGAE